jgi:hypothetical protein
VNTHDAMFSSQDNERSETSLSLDLFESDERVGGVLGNATAMFDRARSKRYVGYLRTLLTAMVADEE